MPKAYRILLAVLLVTAISLSAHAYTLTIVAGPGGTTNPAPGAYSYSYGAKVNIWAIPNNGYKFTNWSGSMTGSLNFGTITINGNKTVTANFAALPAFSPDTALKYFMASVDQQYNYSNYKTVNKLGYSTYFFDMISQQWLDASLVDRPIWQHYMIIHKGWFTGSTAIILIDGGSNGGTPPGEIDEDIGLMSLLSGIPVIDLKQCPNEPLYFTDEVGVRRSEDDILAYGFDKYLTTGDYRWNGHLPMAKAALRGMDTTQRKFSGITKFIVVGASKRGWATWLTAATDDSRIIGFAPIVIPILNVEAQMDHHWESYGFYAPAVDPYSAFDLFCRIKCPAGVDWMNIEDPFCYFGESATISNKPKLMINASGDQFFCTDSLRFYWNQVPGPGTKHCRVIPNASHGMEEGDSFDQALATAMAWGTKVKDNAAQPVYSWVVNGDNSITVTCGSQPSGGARLWQATNPTARDFRYELIGGVWTSSVLPGTTTFTGYCPPPAEGWTAYFVEVDFGSDQKYTTQVVINPDTLPFDGTHCL